MFQERHIDTPSAIQVALENAKEFLLLYPCTGARIVDNLVSRCSKAEKVAPFKMFRIR